MTLHEKLLAIQDAAATAVSGAAYLAGVEVLTERKGDLEQRIRAALAKVGLSVVVMTPEVRVLKREDTRLRLRARVIVECAEIALTNQGPSGSGKPAFAAAGAAAAALFDAPTGLDARGLDTFQWDEDPIVLVPDKALLVYHAQTYAEFSFTKTT